jgi:predicted transcriptional regulator
MSVSAHNRKYKEEHSKVILDSFCLEKNDFLFNSGSNSITKHKHKLSLVNEECRLNFKQIWIVISKLQKLGMDELPVSLPGKYKVMEAKFGSSASNYG